MLEFHLGRRESKTQLEHAQKAREKIALLRSATITLIPSDPEIPGSILDRQSFLRGIDRVILSLTLERRGIN